MTADFANGRVVVPVRRTIGCEQNEYAVVHRAGKQHESMFVCDATCAVHTAMLLAGSGRGPCQKLSLAGAGMVGDVRVHFIDGAVDVPAVGSTIQRRHATEGSIIALIPDRGLDSLRPESEPNACAGALCSR